MWLCGIIVAEFPRMARVGVSARHCATLRLFSFFPPLLTIPTAGSQRRYPWRETVMRTFHPFSSPHIAMPDAAHLDAHLHQAASKSSSPRPPSPPQPSLDILVDSTSPPAEHIPHQSTQQLSPVKSQPPSSNNGIVSHTHPPVIAAPPSILSNPDPSASLQSILAASRKDQLPPESALHHWAISPPASQLAASHHVTLLPQVSPSLPERLNASLFTSLSR